MARRSIPREVRTARLLLRQWRDEDVEPLFEIYQQPDYLTFMPAMDLDATSAQVQMMKEKWEEEGHSLWAAEEVESGQLVGRIGLVRHHDWPLAPDPVEVGWVLHRDYWGRGLATEGGKASIRVWRDYLPDDERLLSITVPENRRSRAVMERLGMKYGGQTTLWREGFTHVWYVLAR